MAHHGSLTASEDIHLSYAWAYANAAARTGATGFVSTDVGKFARQLDTNAIYMLTAVTPTWIQVAGAGSVTSLDDVGDVNAPAPTVGQVLTWDDTPGEWVAATPSAGSVVPSRLGWVTGRYQIYPYSDYGGLGSFAGVAVVANRAYAGPPMFFHRAGQVTAMGFFVNTAVADSLARIGFYSVDDRGKAVSPVLDAGTIATIAAGAKEITGLTWTPAADTFYVPVIVCSHAITILHTPGGEPSRGPQSFGTTVITNVTPGWNSMSYDTLADTTFPDPFTQDGFLDAGNIPCIWVKQT